MIVEIPKTLEDFKKVRETILELMANPYCDQFMFLLLSHKLDKTNAKIEELSNNYMNEPKKELYVMPF